MDVPELSEILKDLNALNTLKELIKKGDKNVALKICGILMKKSFKTCAATAYSKSVCSIFGNMWNCLVAPLSFTLTLGRKILVGCVLPLLCFDRPHKEAYKYFAEYCA